jgi:hypothetical protein
VGGGADDRVALGRRVSQSHDFGVRAACWLGMALAEQLAQIACQQAADSRVGVRYPNGATSNLQGEIYRVRRLIRPGCWEFRCVCLHCTNRSDAPALTLRQVRKAIARLKTGFHGNQRQHSAISAVEASAIVIPRTPTWVIVKPPHLSLAMGPGLTGRMINSNVL